MRQQAQLRELLIVAAYEGATAEQIARALGVSRSTVWRHYGEQLRRAKLPKP
ncbi:MAG TPA: helix-turn-helix domain-containing protein [Solirubrobacteraceae bacterium]|nr:helix-turn-helix domain-containing protein [Solirubrobacteraceae bacterium]